MPKRNDPFKSSLWCVSFSGRGFSLIEVILALGIAAFSLVLLIGMLPIGLQSNRESREESVAVNLVNALISDLECSPKTDKTVLYQMPKVVDTVAGGIQPAASVKLLFDEDLKLLPSATDPSARYAVAVDRLIWTDMTLTPILYSIGVTSLPLSASSASPMLIETVVAIPRN